jgi:hypothetical protein
MQNPRFAAHCSTFVAIITFFVVGMMAGTARSQSAVTQPVINYARIDLIQESSNHKVREDTLEENSITGKHLIHERNNSFLGRMLLSFSCLPQQNVASNSSHPLSCTLRFAYRVVGCIFT